MLAAFSVTPLGVGASVGEVVAECVRLVRESGLPHETTAMYTTVEGDWDDIQALIGRCVDHASSRAPRVSVMIKLDHRPGHDEGLEHKRRRVEELLEQSADPGPAAPVDRPS